MTEEERIRRRLERWQQRDVTYKALTSAVRRAQASLRRVATDDAWQMYLVVEEQVNARHHEIISAAIRLASARPRAVKRR